MFEKMWSKIIEHTGETFYTKRELPFTYQIVSNRVVPDRTGYPIAKSDFEKASKIENLTGPGQISNLVRGSAYVFAIITDERVK